MSLLVFATVFILVYHYQAYWLIKINLIEQVLYGLFALTIILSSYFNRSRLTLAALVLLSFYLTISNAGPWQKWLLSHRDWLLLAGTSIFSVLSTLKDRNLLSIHGLYRLILISSLAIASYYWFDVAEYLKASLVGVGVLTPYLKYITIALPLMLFSLLLIWQNLYEKSLVTTVLFSTFCIWGGHYYQLFELPWSVLLTLLMLQYLCVVFIDSYFLAYRDELTGLPSRRALNQRALSLGRKYTVAMLDIDHFKKFNDTYGHDIGDQVLKLVASKLAKVKGSGKVYRYGGEEFTIIFAGKSIAQAKPALEAVRQAVEDYKIVIRQQQRSNKKARSGKKSYQTKTVSVTISIGLASKEAKLNFEQSLKLADQALYRAKKSGRNKVSE